MATPQPAWRNVSARESRRGLVYTAIVQADRVRHHLGSWFDAREAAIAVDRATLHFGIDATLNIPEESRRRGPASPAELRVLARASRPKVTHGTFFGVSRGADGTFRAQIGVAGRSLPIARFFTELDAARAYDRVARKLLGAPARLNFPDERLRPATIDEIRQEQEREVNARIRAKASSRYDGVSHTLKGGWEAYVPLAGTNLHIATYDDELAAALAYDRAALHFFGPGAARNFPRRRTTPASIAELRAERRAEVKQRSTSKFTGVSWSKRQKSWWASISVGPRKGGKTHHLGYFAEEEDAARAYDRALYRFRDERKGPLRMNFPSEWGRWKS